MGGGVRRPGSRSDSSAAKCCSSAGLSPAEAEHDGRHSRLSLVCHRPASVRPRCAIRFAPSFTPWNHLADWPLSFSAIPSVLLLAVALGSFSHFSLNTT